MKRLPFLVGMLVAVATVGARQAVFRSSVDLVSVDVSVTSGKTAVSNLTSDSFELLDNGIAQKIDAVSVESLPVDVTLVLDVSDSVKGSMLVRLRRAVADTSALLTPRDRLRLVTFSNILREPFGFRPGGSVPVLDETAVGGATSLYDGLVAAMLRVRPQDRRHLIIAFTDGIDSSSFFSVRSAREVALRADAVVHVVIGVQPPVLFTRTPPAPAINTRPLDDLARATGGLVTVLDLSESISRAFKRVIEDFRTSYVLRYAATGVKREGWHEITVRVKKQGRYDVRARKGYSGGQ